jgi:hypothetical protein
LRLEGSEQRRAQHSERENAIKFHTLDHI